MTKEEAKKLKRGDRVIGLLIGQVNSVHSASGLEMPEGFVRIEARGERNSKGAPRRGTFDYLDVHKLDLETANVYADWLDDHGFYEAATALRKAFPLDEGKVEGEEERRGKTLDNVLLQRRTANADSFRYGPFYRGWTEDVKHVPECVLTAAARALESGEDYGDIQILGEYWYYWKAPSEEASNLPPEDVTTPG